MVRSSLHRQRGYAYWLALIALSLAAVGTLRVSESWSIKARQQQEEELLFVGDQYRRAIASYYEATPGPVKVLPRQLEELLEDKRHPGIVRHLRRLYGDPVSAYAPLEVVRDPNNGGILGVHSANPVMPLKQAGFPERHRSFTNSKSYQGWRFMYQPPVPGPQPQ